MTSNSPHAADHMTTIVWDKNVLILLHIDMFHTKHINSPKVMFHTKHHINSSKQPHTARSTLICFTPSISKVMYHTKHHINSSKLPHTAPHWYVSHQAYQFSKSYVSHQTYQIFKTTSYCSTLICFTPSIISNLQNFLILSTLICFTPNISNLCSISLALSILLEFCIACLQTCMHPNCCEFMIMTMSYFIPSSREFHVRNTTFTWSSSPNLIIQQEAAISNQFHGQVG